MTIQQLLIKHWGHKSFRPLQEEIINSVLDGRDTLALLPTGGGKSICFQIPALAKAGICIVISPLIALMKDQVEKLKKKDIKAIAVYSGMNRTELDIAFDNCIYGDIKLLYLSPERLKSDLAIARIRKMKVNLIAVDEAHCISQWGYDFRPPYLKIAEIREYLPGVPVLALTATATADVVEDIQKKLLFKAENVFRSGFERKNLIYKVSYEADKSSKLIKFLKKQKGQGIIYTRGRLRTSEISEFLNKNKFSSTFYHAGLDDKLRVTRQNDWNSGKTSIIVCTTAFGMGIDKPDVRFVVHYDPPDCLEEYYQESGRAGRDGNRADALLLYSEADSYDLEKKFNLKYPGIDRIKDVYKALGSYFQLAVGSGQDLSLDFDIKDFSDNFNFEVLAAFSSIKFLEREGFLILTENVNSPARLFFKADKAELYNFMVENIQYAGFIEEILRIYGGSLYNDYRDIYESEIAFRTKKTPENVIKILERLRNFELCDYIPRKTKPQIIWCQPRMDVSQINISKEVYADRRKVAETKLKAFIAYATNDRKCRCQLLLSYFGEEDAKRCGECDVCQKRNILELNEIEFDIVVQKIKPILQHNPLTMNEIYEQFENIEDEKVRKVIKWLRENGKIFLDTDNKLHWS